MKKVIRLTESDLHNIIKESVKRVLKEGWVSNDGNGMVGGWYGSWGYNGVASLPWEDLVQAIIEEGLISPEKEDALYSLIATCEEELSFEGELEINQDDSTNYYGEEVLPDEESFNIACEYFKKEMTGKLSPQIIEFSLNYFKQYYDENCEKHDAYTWDDDPIGSYDY